MGQKAVKRIRRYNAMMGYGGYKLGEINRQMWLKYKKLNWKERTKFNNELKQVTK